MKLKNLLFVFFSLFASLLVAQTTEIIADWETPGTSYSYTSFGNGHFGDSVFVAIANPNSSGINTSDTVAAWMKANDAKTWGGLTIVPSEEINFKGSIAKLRIKVLAADSCDVLLKVEGSETSEPASLLMPYTTPNEWQELTFDYSVADGQGDIGLGHIFTKVAIFLDFGLVPAADAVYYFDDLTKVFGGLYVDPDQTMISDNETGDTTDIFAFGNGHFGDSTFTIVPNPDSSIMNPSTNVHAWCEANNASGWGGFGLILDTIDFTGNKASICISMRIDHEANIRIKMAGSETGPDVRIEQPYTTPGEWQQICFDFTKPGTVNGNLGLGHLYTRMDFYMDYGSSQDDDDCYYFDDILIISNGTGVVPQLIENLINANTELTTFKGYIEQVDFWGEINKNGVTVFAPSNDAFNALSATEKDALDNNTDNAIYNMIMHHMVYDSLPADMLTDGLNVMTRNGQDGTISGTAINGANIASSEEAINGFLHTLDGVMQYPADPDVYIYTDFEGDGSEDDTGWWWWGTDGNDAFKIIDNPHKDDVNGSDKVAEYKKFPVGLWYQGIASMHNRQYNFFGPMKKVCFDVYSPEGDHVLFLKLDKALTPNVKSGWEVSYTGGGWTTICFDATEPDYYNAERNGENNIFPGSALFFDANTKTLPADTVIFYIDNWRTENIETTGISDISSYKHFKIFPNPATEYLKMNSDAPVKTAFVYDITGSLMLTFDNPVTQELNISSLKTGMYFIKAVGLKGENRGIVKFIKK
jgi:hypothetical protein